MELLQPAEFDSQEGRATVHRMSECPYIYVRHRPCVHGVVVPSARRPGELPLKRVAGTAVWCPVEVSSAHHALHSPLLRQRK